MVSVTTSRPKRLYLATWGCQMNVYDSRRMADTLACLGYGETRSAEEADLVILNTCHIREKATEKLFSELGRLYRLKERRQASGAAMMLAVAGCVAQAQADLIFARAPFVDLVVGPQAYHRLPALIARAEQGERVTDTEFPAESKFDYLPEETAPPGLSAFLAIQEGCDKFCSFCVVPFTRGAEVSRPARAVLAEARRLIGGGAREITLLGQNVNAWHGEGPDRRGWSLARLLYALAELLGLWRLRYTTSHPREMDEGLIRAHRDIPALMPFLHLPVQSGSDRVLQAMNRRHTAADYRRLVERLRAARPDLALSTDIIVGFPGETRSDFEATLALVREVSFAQAFSFKYSPRPGTKAAELPKQVKEPEKEVRLRELQSLLAVQACAFNRASVGRRLEVLFTGPGRHPGQIAGRSPYLQPVHCLAPATLIGELAAVRIEAALPHSLSATLAEESNAA